MTAAALRCRDLRVERASGFVLRIPELELARGSVTAVGGPNGSGKSTLLLACAGLCDLAGGTVELDGVLAHQGRAPAPARLRQRVVLVPQDPYLLRGTVGRNLSWGLRLRGVPAAERRDRCAQVLSVLDLDGVAERSVAELSGGQRTLVALARALVLRPAVLLLDEVTRDLDERHRKAAVEAIREQTARDGTAVLLATHDQETAGRLADTRVVLAEGRIAGAASLSGR